MPVKPLLAALCALALCPTLVDAQDPGGENEPVVSPFPSRVETVSGRRVKVGPIRVVLRGYRTPLATPFRDGQILLSAGSAKVGAVMVRSRDRGHSWAREANPLVHLNTLELADGTVQAIDYRIKPIEGESESYSFDRWQSTDQGKTHRPVTKGRLGLPESIFDPRQTNWFHGNLVQLQTGELLTVMQGEQLVEGKSTWRSFLVRSTDGGATWRYESMLADHHALAPIRERLQANGWRLHGVVEANLLAIEDSQLLCVARVMDDESNVPVEQFSPPIETYHDLSYTISGEGMHTGIAHLPADRYYVPGRRSCPLILMRSSDGGATWSKPEVMTPARGCFPRMATDGKVIALSYGGGSGALRWGNFVCFSFDGGRTWSGELNVGPFLSTGYTSIVTGGERKFVVFFDCTPPQPWTEPAAHWIGAVDVEIVHDSNEEPQK